MFLYCFSSAPQVLLSVQDERKEQINCFDFLHITIDSRKNAMNVKWSWIVVMLLCAYPCAAENDRKGMTWGVAAHDNQHEIDLVACAGKPQIEGQKQCDPIKGDTSCSVALPILCIKPDESPRPNYEITGQAHAMPAEYYRGWAGGRIGLTEPMQGKKIESLSAANTACAMALGEGYRMAEFHDGKYIKGMGSEKYYGDTWPSTSSLSSGGWAWYAYGNIDNERRFWVSINDQSGNCWN